MSETDPRELARAAIAAAQLQDDLAAARERIARETGIGEALAERLNGSTVGELEADAAALVEAVAKARAAPAEATDDPLLASLRRSGEKSRAHYERIFGGSEDSP